MWTAVYDIGKEGNQEEYSHESLHDNKNDPKSFLVLDQLAEVGLVSINHLVEVVHDGKTVGLVVVVEDEVAGDFQLVRRGQCLVDGRAARCHRGRFGIVVGEEGAGGGLNVSKIVLSADGMNTSEDVLLFLGHTVGQGGKPHSDLLPQQSTVHNAAHGYNCCNSCSALLVDDTVYEPLIPIATLRVIVVPLCVHEVTCDNVLLRMATHRCHVVVVPAYEGA